jgi:hypothetical protein
LLPSPCRGGAGGGVNLYLTGMRIAIVATVSKPGNTFYSIFLLELILYSTQLRTAIGAILRLNELGGGS